MLKETVYFNLQLKEVNLDLRIYFTLKNGNLNVFVNLLNKFTFRYFKDSCETEIISFEIYFKMFWCVTDSG